MIPTEFIVALVFTTLLLLYKTINIPNKYINTILATVLSFGTSISWCVAIVDSTKVYACIMAGIAAVIFGLVLLVFTWHESLYINEEDVHKPVDYTTDSLVGTTGVVEDSLGGETYLGSLNDGAATKIVVYLNRDDVYDGSLFTVTGMDGDKIFGRVIDE